MDSFRRIWRTLLVLIIPAAIFMLTTFLLAFMVNSGAITDAVFFPDDGTWYCKELRIQLSFEASKECFLLVDEEKIQCVCGSDRGSSRLYVLNQDENTDLFHLGEEVFGGEFVSLDETKLVIFEPERKTEYTFIRNSD